MAKALDKHSDTQMMSKQASKQARYYISKISHNICDTFLKRHHYLSQQGHGFLGLENYGLFTKDHILCGVVVFSGISVIETLIGAFEGFTRESSQQGFYELSRLSMDDDLKERNLTSWFLARAIKQLRHDNQVRAIISYADSRYHHGYIYQATNFKYYGLTDAKTDYFIIKDGVEKQVQRGTVKNTGGFWKPRPRKHRYLLVFDKSLCVKWKESVYPKGNNTEYELSTPKYDQLTFFDIGV